MSIAQIITLTLGIINFTYILGFAAFMIIRDIIREKRK